MNNEIQAIIIDCGRLLINFSLYWVNIPPRAKSAIGIPALASKFNASVRKYGIGIWDTLNKKPKISLKKKELKEEYSDSEDEYSETESEYSDSE